MRRILTTASILLVALVLGAAIARAEEPGTPEQPGALERLTAEERAQLESRVAGWADLTAERKEKIALTMIRLRDMSEEKRRALLERIERLKRGREAGRGPRPGRLEHHLDPRRMKDHRRRGHVMRAVGDVLWGELPEATRTRIESSLEKHERGHVSRAFFRRLVGRIAEERARDGVPPIPVPPDVPPEWKQGMEELRAKAEAGDEGALKRLAHMSVFHDLQRVADELGRDGPPDEDAVRRLGARVRKAYPEAFAASIAELEEAAGSEESLRRYAPPSTRGRGGRSSEHQARRLLEALEQSDDLVRQHPELKEHVRKLKRALKRLVGDRPPAESPGGHGRRPGFPGGRRGPPGGRGERRGPQPPPDGPPPDGPRDG